MALQLRRRGADSGQQVVFMHLPKCGGTSLAKAMTADSRRRRSREAAVFQLDPVASKTAADARGTSLRDTREALLLYALASDTYGLVLGHFWFSQAAVDAWPNWQWVTLLRHPVDRWMSQYFYNLGKQSEHFRVSDGIEKFVQTDRGRAMGSHYVSKLADDGTDPQKRQEQALSRLDRFSLVGTLEELPAFVEDYRRIFRSDLAVPHLNRNPTDVEARYAQIHPELRAAVAETCRPDIQVYQAAQQMARRRREEVAP